MEVCMLIIMRVCMCMLIISGVCCTVFYRNSMGVCMLTYNIWGGNTIGVCMFIIGVHCTVFYWNTMGACMPIIWGALYSIL